MGINTTMRTKIQFNVRDGTHYIISEIKKEQIQEVLDTLIRSQIGIGGGDGKPKEKNIYTIVIDLDLSGDTFNVKSDTENKSLTTGILMDLVLKLNKNSEKVKFGN